MAKFGHAVESERRFSEAVTHAVRAGLLLAAHEDFAALDAALREMCAEARRDGRPPEQVVIALKRIWYALSRPAVAGSMSWDSLYHRALSSALGYYFEADR